MDTCLNCQKPIVTKAKGRPKKYCSLLCGDQYRKPRKPPEQKHIKEERKIILTICDICGNMFEAGNNRAMYCSSRCKHKSDKINDRIKKFQKECVHCKAPFETTNKSQKYCSTNCYTIVMRETSQAAAIERAKNDVPRHIFPSKRAREEYRRRRRIRENWVEHVDLAVLIERDKGICQLCSRSVWIEAPHNHPLEPTNDHRIALSKGGEHSYANCQLACRECNTAKNNRTEVKTNVTTKQKRKSASPQVAN
jgi:5-methylcytosine-specific restriction endonuclease McrA